MKKPNGKYSIRQADRVFIVYCELYCLSFVIDWVIEELISYEVQRTFSAKFNDWEPKIRLVDISNIDCCLVFLINFSVYYMPDSFVYGDGYLAIKGPDIAFSNVNTFIHC